MISFWSRANGIFDYVLTTNELKEKNLKQQNFFFLSLIGFLTSLSSSSFFFFFALLRPPRAAENSTPGGLDLD
jgi:hypothetical protein